MIIKALKKLKDWVDPNYWATKIGDKSGAYDKAHNSKLAQWSRSLTGWKWWAYQIVGGLIAITFLEILLRIVGLTILPF